MHLTPLEFTIVAFLVSILAGVFGALLGLGGGVIVIPALTLLLKVDMRFAIGASIVAVIATSSGSAASYVRERLSNLRIGMLLEMFTTTGAVCGAYLSGLFPVKYLYLIFAGVLGITAAAMFLKKREVPSERPDTSCRLADRLRLHGDFYGPRPPATNRVPRQSHACRPGHKAGWPAISAGCWALVAAS